MSTSWPAPIALAKPQPGDFCCVPMQGQVGVAVTIGQYLDGDKFQFYDHAEVYVGLPDKAGPYGYTVSAYPGGKGKRPLPGPAGTQPGSLWSSGILAPTSLQREGIVKWCLENQNVQYSFLDYGALVAHGLHLPVPGLKGYVKSTGHMICSWYTDASWLYGPATVGAPAYHLFDDGRWEGYVKPGDLAMLLQQKGHLKLAA